MEIEKAEECSDCPEGQGWFANVETGMVERCDTCKRFEHDDAAVDAANQGMGFAKRQAIKHFDELLTEVQQVVSCCELAENDADGFDKLKAILRKISDEVVEEVKR